MFEWDPNKNEANLKKHGISFADTFAVFEDPAALTVEDDSDKEERFVTMGMDLFGRILIVVYTWRDENIRIISARKATKPEVREYESQV
ncbi:MAG: BrnT family toxin [Candidatus Sumerlaeia bacterium]